jgi:hypothetical protein
MAKRTRTRPNIIKAELLQPGQPDAILLRQVADLYDRLLLEDRDEEA